MVKLFGRGGYRTVAIMPGMLVAWPEGAFYGFEHIYDHDGLDYLGPQFGWWDINDQYALARVDALEIEPARDQPAFVFFTTISTADCALRPWSTWPKTLDMSCQPVTLMSSRHGWFEAQAAWTWPST